MRSEPVPEPNDEVSRRDPEWAKLLKEWWEREESTPSSQNQERSNENRY